MPDPISAIFAGALAEVAAAATVGTMAGGVIGNRTDALLTRSFRAISAGFRHLSGDQQDSSAALIVRSVQHAFKRSFGDYLDTLSTQTTNFADRSFLDSLTEAAESQIDAVAPSVGVHLADAVRPLLASISAANIWEEGNDKSSLIYSIVEWIEGMAGPMPSHFRAILTQNAPNGRRAWIAAFRDELGSELLQNKEFEKLLIISNLSDVAEVSTLLRTSAEALHSGLSIVDAKLGRVDRKVDQLIVHQDSQLAQLQTLSGLLHQIGSAASPEMCSRVLASTIFNSFGEMTPVALIFLSSFGTPANLDTISRHDRQLLIRDIHARLINVVGEISYVGRHDGGEFDIIIRDIRDYEELNNICRKIEASFYPEFFIGENTFTLKPKMGAALSPQHGFSPDILQRNADLALRSTFIYGAKDIIIYSPDLHSDAEDRKQIAIDLKRAILSDELQVLFQPVISLSSGNTVGYEALVRWVHPERGQVPPHVFIPIAEETGIAGEMEAWALRSACSAAAEWQDDIWVAVNISAFQLSDPDFPSSLADIILSSGLPANRLEIEFTESVFLIDQEDISSSLRKLEEIGVRLSIDDFGTGYSSLGYLRKLPLNKIKIDQSYVRGITQADTRNAAIVEAIVALAGGMQMEVVAEGVETEAELEAIKLMGCTYAQGYLFGHPVEATRINMR